MMRFKCEDGHKTISLVFFFALVAMSLSQQSLAMECQDQIIQAPDWSSNVTVRYATNVTSPENVIYDPADNTTFTVGIYNITAMLSGSTDCTFRLVVLANPVCPTSFSQSNDENVTTANVIWDFPSENRIDLFPLTSNPSNGTTFDLGVTDVTVFITDFPDYRCTFQVEVKDEQPPWLTCPESLNVNNSALATWNVPIASDNSGKVLLSSSHSPGSYFQINTSTEITYTAVDGSGNSATCSFNLTIVPDGSPEIMNCPSNINKETSVGVTSTTVTELWTQEPTAISPSGSTVTPSSNFSRISTFDLGTTKVTYTFRDENGLSSKCVFLVSITSATDTEAPRLDDGVTCPSTVIRDAPPGTTELQVIYDEPTFTDNIDGKNIVITQTKSSGSTFTAGSTQVLYVAADSAFNMNTNCIIDVIVNVTEDNENPVISGCPANRTRWVREGESPVVVDWTSPNATDNFEVVNFNSSHWPRSMFDEGVTRVTYTATDLVNRQDTCEFYITIIIDTELPVVDCPDDINVFVGETVNSLPVMWEPPYITDNSGMVTMVPSHQSGDSFGANNSTPVTIEVTDEAGNVGLPCIFIVSVIVDPAPVLSCPSEMIINSTVSGQSYADIYWLDEITVTDDTPVTAIHSHESPLRVELNSPIMVNYTVRDLRNNTKSCTFQLQANDTEGPVWSPCPSDIIQEADPGTNSAIVSWNVPVNLTDNSGETPTVEDRPTTPQRFFRRGITNTITYIALDGSGNRGTCQFDVTVTVDSEVPEILNCPNGSLVFSTPTGAASAAVTWDDITATDTADGPLAVQSDINPGDVLAIGIYVIQYRATDSRGNVATCEFQVEVNDPEPPTITSCPDDIIAYARSQTSQIPVSWTEEATATDNSGTVTVFSNPASGSLFTTGQTTQVVYSAKDPSGNEAANPCPFTVTVQTADLITIRGSVTLDQIRGNGVFTDQPTAEETLQADLVSLFRTTNLAPEDFVDVEVSSSVIVSDSNLRASFTLYFAPDSHYNKGDIEDIFYNALENRVSFDSGNVILPESFDLDVREFRGEFTLRSILPSIAGVDFASCCSDPNSQSYQSLLERIYTYFTATFGSMSFFRMARLLPLQEGSIIVPYTLTFDRFTQVNLNDIETAFNATVQEATRELAQTDLFLMLTGGIGETVEVCPVGYCRNGGTCNILTDTYSFSCSCQSGFTGAQCEDTTTTQQLSTGAIIGILLGVMGFILVLLVVCCCCLWLMGARSGMLYDEEKLMKREPRPLLMLPMDEEYYRPPPRRTRPTITEIPNEPDPRPTRPPTPPPSEGPSFLHEDPLFLQPAQPAPKPAPAPQPMILPRPHQHMIPRSSPPHRRERPPGYYETEEPPLPPLSPPLPQPPPPQLSPQILMLPQPAPRWRRVRDHVDRYLQPRRVPKGPRFRGSRQPEPLKYAGEQLPPSYEQRPVHAYHQGTIVPGPQFIGDYAPDSAPMYHQGGGPIRRSGSRRQRVPQMRGNHFPEEVGEMKQRLFHEFNY
ncbi:hyalin-like isoform X1 [Lytechinus pictus]|uniref:hyalin-like isoform X1 n=1 Tax=Lytechinus pictus TaxID=7653 RepID=UPI0030BA059A